MHIQEHLQEISAIPGRGIVQILPVTQDGVNGWLGNLFQGRDFSVATKHLIAVLIWIMIHIQEFSNGIITTADNWQKMFKSV